MTLTPHPESEKLIAIAEGKQMQLVRPTGVFTDVSAEEVLYWLHCDPSRVLIKPDSPPTITINGHEFPEPLRVAPENGTEYWLISLKNLNDPGHYHWHSDKTDYRWLDAGLCQATQQGAIDCAKALLSLLEVQS